MKKERKIKQREERKNKKKDRREMEDIRSRNNYEKNRKK